MQFGILSLIIGLFLTPADALSGILIKWGASSGWSWSLYFPSWNSDQTTIGKTHPTLLFKLFDNIDTALLFLFGYSDVGDYSMLVTF